MILDKVLVLLARGSVSLSLSEDEQSLVFSAPKRDAWAQSVEALSEAVLPLTQEMGLVLIAPDGRKVSWPKIRTLRSEALRSTESEFHRGF